MSEANQLKSYLDEEGIEVSEEKLKRMIYKIYSAERSNTKTGKYNEREMKDLIKQIIEEELDKCY